jgi:hypothetical protein
LTLLKKFFNLSFREKLLFLEALSYLYLAKAMLLLLPFRWCLRLMREKGAMDHLPVQEELLQIKRAVGRANKLAFWKNVCLVQSVAARWMLRRRKIHSEVIFGVKPGEEKTNIMAHAWVESHGMEVVNRGGNYQILFKT